MKKFCSFVAVAVCLGISGVAHATIIGFAANILDPSPPGGTFLYSDTFSAPFSDCSAFSSPSAPSAVQSDYCFEGINATGQLGSLLPAQVWTSLTITLDDPSNILGLNGSCGSLDPGDSIFGSSSCTSTNGVDTLSFIGGAGISTGQSFFIAIQPPTAVTLTDLDGLPTTAVAGVAPEPNPALLLITGTAMFGLLLYAERRRLARQSSSS